MTTRATRKPTPRLPPPADAPLDAAYESVTVGVLDLDVEQAHGELSRRLLIGETPTGVVLLDQLDRAHDRIRLARTLAARARRDYEVYKEQHEAWMELKKSAARVALEEEKKEKELKKQITNDMIVDQVRATWPEEYLERFTRLKDFQASVHVLEELAETWKDRPRALQAMANMVLQLGAPAPIRGR